MAQNQFYIQNNFTHGELDPRLFAGTNLDYYYKSLKKARNVYVRPQGGVKRRHGTKYLKTIQSQPNEYRLLSFVFNSDTQFILIMSNLEILAYQVDPDSGDITNTFPIVTPYTTAQLPDVQWAQNGNLMIFVHPDVAPQTLSWDDTGSTFNAMAALEFKNYPPFDYSKDYFSYKFKIAPQTIGLGAVLTCDNAVFTANHIGGTFIGLGSTVTEPLGLAKITNVTGPYPATTATVDIIFPFASTMSAFTPGDNCFLGEIAFNSTNGFPKTVGFYEGRLIFGGTNDAPQTLFMSRIGAFNDFYIGNSADDDAIIFTLSSNEYNEIKYLVSDKSLQIFCTEAEYASMQYFAEPLTPSTASFRKQSAYGVSDVLPVILDNQTFYVREGGSAIMAYVFNGSTNSYNSIIASIYSDHLVDDPVSSAVLKGDSLENADYVFFVNADGSLLVFQTLVQQDVSAFTLCVTGNDHINVENIAPNTGKFMDIVNVKDKIYVAVQRHIDNVDVQYLEQLTFSLKTDCSVQIDYPHATNIVTGLSYLEGEYVRVIGDGKVLTENNQVKVTSGSITLDTSASSFIVGLNYNVFVQTIPINIAGSGRLYMPGKIVRAWVDYYESLGIKVNGEFVPDMKFGPHVLDEIVLPQTGVFSTRGNEWGIRESITIEQIDPLPFLVIGIGFEVNK